MYLIASLIMRSHVQEMARELSGGLGAIAS